MTKEEREADAKARMADFQTDLAGLVDKHKLKFRPIIREDGPALSFTDLKNYEEVPLVQEK